MSVFLNIGSSITMHAGIRAAIMRTGLLLENKKTQEIRMYVRDARKHVVGKVDADWFPCIMMYGPMPDDIKEPEPRGLISEGVSIDDIVIMLESGEWFVRRLKAELL